MPSTLPYSLRPFQAADMEAVVTLINAYSMNVVGTRRAVVDGVGHIRLARYVSASHQQVVAVDAHGMIVGLCWLLKSSALEIVVNHRSDSQLPDAS